MAKEISIKKALKNLEKLVDVNLDENFVAIGSYLNDKRFCSHSLLVICYNKKLKIFHYTGNKVELIDPESDKEIFLKKIEIIHEDEVVAFLGFCEELLSLGFHPTFGFIFSDSFYDPYDKSNFLKNAKHNITTCSGFCIKVIRGFLYNNPEYVFLKDWTIESYEKAPDDLKSYMFYVLSIYATENKTTLDNLFKLEEIKRITPLELLIAAYFNDLPIRKESIDSLIKGISDSIIKAA